MSPFRMEIYFNNLKLRAPFSGLINYSLILQQHTHTYTEERVLTQKEPPSTTSEMLNHVRADEKGERNPSP